MKTSNIHFGGKLFLSESCVGEEHADHLMSILKQYYEIRRLDWDYENNEVHISKAGYVKPELTVSTYSPKVWN